jgi:hypothetical protein
MVAFCSSLNKDAQQQVPVGAIALLSRHADSMRAGAQKLNPAPSYEEIIEAPWPSS